jgi:hypothetical protein
MKIVSKVIHGYEVTKRAFKPPLGGHRFLSK